MRSIVLSFSSSAIVTACALLFVGRQSGTVKVQIQLVDKKTGAKIAGLIRVVKNGDEKAVRLKGAYDRFKGLKVPASVRGWYVVPAKGTTIELPRGKLTVECISGLEFGKVDMPLNTSARTQDKLVVEMPWIFRPEDMQLAAGNTHLHLRNMSLKQADEYVRKIPAADRLKVLFVSYLERFKDDESYITNKYPIGDLKQFNATGVLVNNGEEHRHNFTGFGEGYGHVMLLNIRKLIKPVSIGPGIMKSGFDDTPLRTGIDNARKQGGTIIWCHNTFGVEDVLNAITGRLHALNVFDGSRRGKFEEAYYRYLNLGIRMPISTGTDWFMYDFARVYAQVKGKLTIPAWLQAVKAGRCIATNGPLLTLEVDGQGIGSVIKLKEQKKVRIVAKAVGRHNFQRLQLIHNGRVIHTMVAKGKEMFSAALEKEMVIDSPAWFALRISSDTKNEMDYGLFAHTSPIYINVAGARVFDVDAAQALLKEVEYGVATIKRNGTFSNEKAKMRVLALYDEGARVLRKSINKRTTP